ncbi:MAG TPA: molybdenum cofactor biosynthesis protein MoaE, partial [Holophaga sp.]|nr:molybdenum cofactor biosynthesis protein MoaE [Holophaga sp.]
HRVGVVPLMEAAVVVVTAASHRREAFEAAAWIMDRIKERVPIWKRERYPDAVDTWVEGEQRHV